MFKASTFQSHHNVVKDNKILNRRPFLAITLLLFSLNIQHPYYASLKSFTEQTSLVVQWLKICLPMQGMQVRSLVGKDSTCHGATKPVGHNC